MCFTQLTPNILLENVLCMCLCKFIFLCALFGACSSIVCGTRCTLFILLTVQSALTAIYFISSSLFPSLPLSLLPYPLPSLHPHLSTDQSVLTRELASLPLSTDTLKHRLRRAELDKKLTEVEDALKIFSRPKVFVKIDD